jgi:uncharacterized protein (DUF1499 family)
MSEAPLSPTPVRTSVVASLAQRIGIFGAASAALGVLAVQVGVIAPITAFMMFAAGCLFGGLGALLLGLIGLFLTRNGDAVGRRNALVGLALGAALFALVYVSALPGQGLPRINDITTDVEDPPSFQAAEGAPDYDGRDMSYPDGFAAQVREGYPDLAPIESDLAADLAFAKARAAAERLGWKIVWQDEEAGVFNAIEKSAMFKFVDDVTVRVRATDGGSRIDIRSKSRDGKGDLGANAARIRRFEQAFGA